MYWHPHRHTPWELLVVETLAKLQHRYSYSSSLLVGCQTCARLACLPLPDKESDSSCSQLDSSDYQLYVTACATRSCAQSPPSPSPVALLKYAGREGSSRIWGCYLPFKIWSWREREERTHALIQYVYSISLCGYMCVWLTCCASGKTGQWALTWNKSRSNLCTLCARLAGLAYIQPTIRLSWETGRLLAVRSAALLIAFSITKP